MFSNFTNYARNYVLQVVDTVSSCFSLLDVCVPVRATFGSFSESKSSNLSPVFSASVVHFRGEGLLPRGKLNQRQYIFGTFPSMSIHVHQTLDLD